MLRKTIRNEITHTIKNMRREAIKEKIEKILNRIKDNKHNIFKVLKKKSKNPGISYIREKNKLITEPNEVKKQTAKFWESLFIQKERGKTQSIWLKQLKKRIFNDDDIHKKITIEEVKQIIKWLKNNKAPGRDEITNELLKLLEDETLIHLVNIMNKCLQEKILPEAWKHSRIYPIFKGTGSENNLNNFRPIALLSIEYKIFTAIINYRLNQIIEKHELISKEQAGFRPDMDTSLNINSLINIINHSNINKKKLHLMYIDLSKAYDSVQH